MYKPQLGRLWVPLLLSTAALPFYMSTWGKLLAGGCRGRSAPYALHGFHDVISYQISDVMFS